MDKICIEKINLNPTGEFYPDVSHTAVNSVAIITGKPWKAVVKTLIEQAHIRANKPTYPTVITDMIRAAGFKKINSYTSLEELLDANQTSSFLIKLHYSGYFALVPENGRFVAKGMLNTASPIILLRKIDEVWQFFPETDNRTNINRKKRDRKIPDDSKKFSGKNINPKNNFVGDCAIRALGGAFDCTWDEALDHLAMASDYSEPVVNRQENINLTLSKLGFERHTAFKSGGKYVTGSEFCNLMSHTYFRGERILVYLISPSHCAAVLPEKQEDGTYLYKIQDSWDCTNKKIGEYWVLKPQKKASTAPPQPSTLRVNETLQHPQYGEGKIVKIYASGSVNIVEVDFGSFGIKKIAETWLSAKKAD